MWRSGGRSEGFDVRRGARVKQWCRSARRERRIAGAWDWRRTLRQVFGRFELSEDCRTEVSGGGGEQGG